MGPQGVGVPQSFSTVAAEEAPPTMGQQVAPELRFLGEGLGTLGTLVGFLPAVDPQVTLEVSFLTEGFPTVLTDVRFLSRVKLHVIPERT